MPKTLEQIKQLVDKLISLGEDSDEFSLWLDIYDTLPDEHKLELGQMFEDELKELEQASNQPTPTPTP